MLSKNIDKPFIGHHDWNGAFWGTMTRSYLNYIESDKFLTSFPSNLVFTHYTPFMPILFTISSKVLHLNEYSLRLVPVMFSVLMIVFVYRIGKVLYGEFEGQVASLFLLATPMFLYFGKMPDHEPIVTSLVTVTFYFYVNSENNRKYFFLFLVFLGLSLLESWPAYFILFPLTFVSLFVRKEKIYQLFVPYLLGVFVLMVHLLLIFLGKGYAGIEGFFSSGIERSATDKLFFGAMEYTTRNFIITEARYAVIYFTRVLLVLSGLFLFNFVFKLFTKRLNKSDIYLMVLFVYPLLFILVFKELAFIHDYKLYHFLPFIAVSASVFFVSLLRKFKNFLERVSFWPIGVRTCLVIITVAVCAMVYLERLPYLKTLQATSFNHQGYDLGNLIRLNTDVEDKVFVDSAEFNAFFGVFVNFYSQRQVDYGDLTLVEFQKSPGVFENYRYFVIVRDKYYDKDLFWFLAGTYQNIRYDNYTFFLINNPIEEL